MSQTFCENHFFHLRNHFSAPNFFSLSGLKLPRSIQRGNIIKAVAVASRPSSFSLLAPNPMYWLLYKSKSQYIGFGASKEKLDGLDATATAFIMLPRWIERGSFKPLKEKKFGALKWFRK